MNASPPLVEGRCFCRDSDSLVCRNNDNAESDGSSTQLSINFFSNAARHICGGSFSHFPIETSQ